MNNTSPSKILRNTVENPKTTVICYTDGNLQPMKLEVVILYLSSLRLEYTLFYEITSPSINGTRQFVQTFGRYTTKNKLILIKGYFINRKSALILTLVNFLE